MSLLTKKLRTGLEVLAKMYHGEPSAVTYANRTQARRKADELGAPWGVYGTRPFYVGRQNIMELFAETHVDFQAHINGLAAANGKTVELVYGWWRALRRK